MKTSIKAEFKVFNTNGKGQTSIGLVLKGDLDDQQILALHRLKAEGVVFAELFNGQADMEDYAHDDVTSEGPHQGVAYSVVDGVVETQVTFEDLGDGEPSKDELEIESIESEVSREEREANDEQATVSVKVLKPFTYNGEKLSKGAVVIMGEADRDFFVAEGIVEMELVDDLPF